MSSHYGRAAVRKSLLHFLFGKSLNAVVSLLTLVALARWLAPNEYGVYIAFVALQASILALSSLGIDSTAERFLPELRTRYADSELLGFVAAAIAARLASLLLLILVTLLAAHPIATLVGLESNLNEFRLWVGVIALTGVYTLAVVLLEAMLHQRQAQRSVSVYVLSKLVLLFLAHSHFHLDLNTLVWVEMLATGFAAMVGSWSLIRHFPPGGVHSGWQLVLSNRHRMQRFAIFNYVAQVVFQFFSIEMMKLLVTRLLGVLQSARYGFASSLADTVQRYLPSVLLLRLIKPVFISRYVKTGDFAELNEMARIILKLNLLVLVPTIALAAVFGGDLLAMLSQDKYTDAQWILVGILGVLMLSSHQLVLSLLAGTLEKNAMQLYAGLASTVAFPFALFLIPTFGSIGAVAASAFSGLIYNTFATFYLRRAGFDYRPDIRGASVLLAAGVALYGVATLISSVYPGPGGVSTALLVGGVAYLALARVFSAFSDTERALLNSILPKHVFIF